MKKELKKLEVTKLDRIHKVVGGAVAELEIDRDCIVCGLGGPILTGGGH
ncbi:MAG: hypothetical protein QNK37_10905 [Acidobacteriota bacterium]|nr:hypothetical protein [Acidobacteriota bacterium]